MHCIGEGGEGRLACMASNHSKLIYNPLISCSWSISCVTLITDSRYSVTDSGSLLISSVIRGDTGQYTCIVKNLAGRVEKIIRVRVVSPVTTPSTPIAYKPLPSPRNLSHCVEYTDVRFGGNLLYLNSSIVSSTSISPRLTIVPHACVQTRVGYRIVLTCLGEGNHTLHWTKDGQPIAVVSCICILIYLLISIRFSSYFIYFIFLAFSQGNYANKLVCLFLVEIRPYLFQPILKLVYHCF